MIGGDVSFELDGLHRQGPFYEIEVAANHSALEDTMPCGEVLPQLRRLSQAARRRTPHRQDRALAPNPSLRFTVFVPAVKNGALVGFAAGRESAGESIPQITVGTWAFAHFT